MSKPPAPARAALDKLRKAVSEAHDGQITVSPGLTVRQARELVSWADRVGAA